MQALGIPEADNRAERNSNINRLKHDIADKSHRGQHADAARSKQALASLFTEKTGVPVMWGRCN